MICKIPKQGQIMKELAQSLILENGNNEFIISITPDWPTIIVTGMIGLGTIMTSFAVAKISKNNQEAQNRAKRAELRKEWINALRESSSKYLAKCLEVNSRITFDGNYKMSTEMYIDFTEVYMHMNEIIFMLEPGKDVTEEIKQLLSDTGQSLFENDDHDKFVTQCHALRDELTNLLEKAWNDIKNDFK